MSHHDDRGTAGSDPAATLAVLESELARGQRLRAIAILVAALAVTGPLATLWATEPGLPARTHLAFGGLVAIGLAWIGVSGWILAVRRPLYARDRVLATGLALGAAAVTGAGSIAIAVSRGSSALTVVASATAALLVGVAGGLHVAARRRRAHLLRRRQELGGA